MNPKKDETYHYYHNDKGDVFCIQVRVEPVGEKKRFYTMHINDGQWEKGAPKTPKKPIYNRLSITLNPEKPVLFVEGEKTADAAIKLFPQYSVVTWLGGSSCAGKADIECVRDKKIFLFPDNDEPGYKAMSELAESLQWVSNDITLIDVKKLPVETGWDLADYNDEHSEFEFSEILSLFEKTEEIPDMIKESFPHLSEKGGILNTYQNIRHLINHYKIDVKYNIVTNRIEFGGLNETCSFVNKTDWYIAEISSLCTKNNVPRADLHNWLLPIADENRYSPAIDFITENKWDGVSRIDEFLSTIESDNKKLTDKLIYRWMLGAVAAAFSEEGISLPGVLVFQGDQGIGKTQWFRSLLPTEKSGLMKDGLTLDPTNKDSIISCTSVWLGELGELDGTFSKSAIAYLKSFTCQSIDSYRAPFARAEKQFPRRTAFYASVNNSSYLVDDTGNRRWWSVAAKSINWNHGIDMQQVWAEFKTLLDSGESYQLEEDEKIELNQANQAFLSTDPIEEMIKSSFDWSSSYRNLALTSTEVLKIIGFDLTNSNTRNSSRRCGAILAKMTGKKSRSSNGRQVFDMPCQLTDI